MRWHGRLSEPLLTTRLPVAGSVVLRQLNGMLPQIIVEMFDPGSQLVYGLACAVTNVGMLQVVMRLRPYDAANDPPGAPKAGTKSLSTYWRLCWYVARKVHSRLRVEIGTTFRPASKPRSESWPPL